VRTVRLGIVGLGNWGSRLARALADMDGAELATCFARTPERREAFAADHGCRPAPSLEAFLEDPDVAAVLVATPHSTHEALITAAAAAGKDVMVEKPLALTTDAAQRCVAAAESAGVLLQVAHYRRHHGATRRLRAMLDADELGSLHHVEGVFNRPVGIDQRRPWRNEPAEAPAGGMTAMGVHVVDNFHYLAGPVRRLCAISKKLGHPSPLDDVTAVLLEFVGGATGTLFTSLRVPTTIATTAYGDGATAWSTDDGHRLLVQRVDERAPAEIPVPRVDGVAANLAAFVTAVGERTPPETGGAAGLAVVEVLDAIVRSAEAGGAWTEPTTNEGGSR
jgi:predicted dehydrogenase